MPPGRRWPDCSSRVRPPRWPRIRPGSSATRSRKGCAGSRRSGRRRGGRSSSGARRHDAARGLESRRARLLGESRRGDLGPDGRRLRPLPAEAQPRGVRLRAAFLLRPPLLAGADADRRAAAVRTAPTLRRIRTGHPSSTAGSSARRSICTSAGTRDARSTSALPTSKTERLREARRAALASVSPGWATGTSPSRRWCTHAGVPAHATAGSRARRSAAPATARCSRWRTARRSRGRRPRRSGSSRPSATRGRTPRGRDPYPARVTLRLDVPREQALTRAAEIVAEAWRSFDRARPSEPPIDDRLRLLLESRVARGTGFQCWRCWKMPAARWTRRSPRSRPRFFAFVASSGLEIGVLGDLLASCFDANLAVWAAAASEIEDQAIRWVAEFVGFPAAAGAFTSGGTISNMTALAAARERAIPGSRHQGLGGIDGGALLLGGGALLDRARGRAARDRLGQRAAPSRSTAIVGSFPRRLPSAIRGRSRSRAHPGRRRRHRGHHADGRGRPDRRRSPTSAPTPASGSTSTEPTVSPPPPRPRPATCSPVSTGPTRSHSMPTSGSTCPRPVGCCSCGAATISSRRSRTKRRTSRTSATGHMVDITLEYSRPFRALKLWLAFRAHGAQAFRDAVEENLRQARLLYELVDRASVPRASVRAAASVDRPVPSRRRRRAT